jgi:hypothetical protein
LNREKQRRYRSTGSTAQPVPANVVSITGKTEKPKHTSGQPNTESPMGPCERAVVEQCEMSEMTTRRPATVEQARAMARILDDWTRKGDWSKASAELHRLLVSLDPPKKLKSGGRLAVVRAMGTSGGRKAQ